MTGASASETMATASDPLGSAILDALRALSREQAEQMARLRRTVEQRDGEIAALKLELRRLEAANAGLHSRLEGRS